PDRREGGIARRAVETLTKLGADFARLVVAIGPSAGPCCYEVGPDVVEFARAAGLPAACIMPTRDGHARLDLWEANRADLVAAGVVPQHIHVAELCTICRPDLFYSYRRDGAGAGRMLGVIARRL